MWFSYLMVEFVLIYINFYLVIPTQAVYILLKYGFVKRTKFFSDFKHDFSLNCALHHIITHSLCASGSTLLKINTDKLYSITTFPFSGLFMKH